MHEVAPGKPIFSKSWKKVSTFGGDAGFEGWGFQNWL
jgi:hypothetical protein